MKPASPKQISFLAEDGKVRALEEPGTDAFNRRWAQHKIDFARHEAQQEAAAFTADVA